MIQLEIAQFNKGYNFVDGFPRKNHPIEQKNLQHQVILQLKTSSLDDKKKKIRR